MALKQGLGTKYPFGSLAFCIKGFTPVSSCTLWLIIISHQGQKRRGFLFMERESEPGMVLVGTPLRGVRCVRSRAETRPYRVVLVGTPLRGVRYARTARR